MKMKSHVVKVQDQEFLIHDIGILRLYVVVGLKNIKYYLRTIFESVTHFSEIILPHFRNIKKHGKQNNQYNNHNTLEKNRNVRLKDGKSDKINFVYRTQKSVHSPYIFFDGLKTALERNGLLNYSYDVNGNEPLDEKALLKCPILCITGSHEPIFNVVKLVNGRQFIAEINSESLNTRQGDLKKLYYDLIRDRSNYFDMYFTPAEIDVNRYFGKPCYWMPSWVHIELLNDISSPVYDELGFIGYVRGREEFFIQDKNKILLLANTLPMNDALEDTLGLCKLINKFKILVNPIPTRFLGMTGKTFEYMACKRLCLCYLNEDYMFKTQLFFKDGEEIVYFKTFDEMEEKYNYYLRNPEDASKIALAGYNKVRAFHNADARAKRFAKLILHHANGGKYDSAFNDISAFVSQDSQL